MKHPGFVRAVLILWVVGQNAKAAGVVSIGKALPLFHGLKNIKSLLG
jgi:hypothetical protein